MKTKSIFKPLLFAVLSVATVFISCKKEPEVTPVIEFENVNALRQTVKADQVKAPQVIKFTTTGAWTSAVHWAPGFRTKHDPDWVRITPDGGSSAKEYSVTVEFDINTTGADRSAIILLYAGGSPVSITVTQEGTTAKGTVPKSSSTIF
ncbi:MAG: BACON domain-containing protein [Bacteroidetes bacterium]|nr:BACON domain-containing protein [Bacteroidota bacterium]